MAFEPQPISIRLAGSSDPVSLVSLSRAVFPEMIRWWAIRPLAASLWRYYVTMPGHEVWVATIRDRAIAGVLLLVAGAAPTDPRLRRLRSVCRLAGIVCRPLFAVREAVRRRSAGAALEEAASFVDKQPTGSHAWIELVGTHPRARGAGVAGALIDAAIERAARLGLNWIGLQVETDNHRAIGLYLQHAFEFVRRTPHGYVMARTIGRDNTHETHR